ncbi:electron transfer flavoprotein subunit beta/FixA family protein [Candidatus Bathyarchaeota archaeon]|nr:electron transfer flavoprotein subunit beta/FixA family protein [Candidatus Bathyarchaeota archaeon]
MDIIVCIKQVPATIEVKIDPLKGTLIREGVESQVNPFDLYALEEGLRLQTRYGGKLSAISMGPQQTESALRDASALGYERTVLLSDKAFAGADTLATAYTLACGIRKIAHYDLIICGSKTTDGDTGQVGPALSEELGISYVGYVKSIVEAKEKSIVVTRSLDDFYEDVEAPLPCVLSVTKEINEPRLPTFKGKMAARKASVETWTTNDVGGNIERFGSNGSPTEVIKVFTPSPRSGGEILQGDPKDQASELIKRLLGRKLLQ